MRALLSPNGDLLFVRRIQNVTEREFLIRARYFSKSRKLSVKESLFIRTYVTQVITLIENWLFFSDDISQKNIKEIIEKVQIMSPIKILKTESKKVAE